jgi:hypothetical protein
MSFRWRTKNVQDADVTVSKEYDRANTNFCNVINGGIDRDNLVEDSIKADGVTSGGVNHYEQYATGRFSLKDNINAHTLWGTTNDGLFTGGGGGAQPNPAGNAITGLHYNAAPIMEGDSWFYVDGTTIFCEEGMLECNWHANVFIPKYRAHVIRGTANEVAMKWVEWRMDVDGVEVCRTSAIFPTWHTAMLNANVPIGRGNHQVDIYGLVAGRKNDTDTQVIFTMFGGQIALFNRRR